jgi:hypothetical protein
MTTSVISKASRKGRCQFDAYQTDAEPSLAVAHAVHLTMDHIPAAGPLVFLFGIAFPIIVVLVIFWLF